MKETHKLDFDRPVDTFQAWRIDSFLITADSDDDAAIKAHAFVITEAVEHNGFTRYPRVRTLISFATGRQVRMPVDLTAPIDRANRLALDQFMPITDQYEFRF